MTEQETEAFKIDPEQWYTMVDIVNHKMFPWVKSFQNIRKFMQLDAKTDNILKPIVTGVGNGKRYSMQGKNIIKFIKIMTAGKTLAAKQR